MKPSEITPLTTLKVTELAIEAGFPSGVINTILGPGVSVGAELSESPDVDLISFTGSLQTGKAIMRAASGNVKKVALELGAKIRISFLPTPISTSPSTMPSTVCFSCRTDLLRRHPPAGGRINPRQFRRPAQGADGKNPPR